MEKVDTQIYNLNIVDTGKCYVCGEYVNFLAYDTVSLREAHCEKCHSKKRTRDIAKALVKEVTGISNLSLQETIEFFKDYKIYEAEAEGNLHNILSGIKGYICSEYFEESDIHIGNNIRNENLEKLTFEDNSFDIVITQDVYEHIQDPLKAFREVERILKPNGIHIFTIPIVESCLTRTRKKGNMDILPEIYHGDPLRKKGAVVFTDYGKDFLKYIDGNDLNVKLLSSDIFYLPEEISPVDDLKEYIDYKWFLENDKLTSFFKSNSYVFEEVKPFNNSIDSSNISNFKLLDRKLISIIDEKESKVSEFDKRIKEKEIAEKNNINAMDLIHLKNEELLLNIEKLKKLESQKTKEIEIEKLSAQVLELKNGELESYIERMQNTKGWRFLNSLRKLKKKLFFLSKLNNNISENGVKVTAKKVFRKIEDEFKTSEYYKWIELFEPKKEELLGQRKLGLEFINKPLISIIVPTYNTNLKMLSDMIESVINQTYENWQLCIADGNSQKHEVIESLKEFSKKDSRIKVSFLDKNNGIIGNSQAAVEMCTGEYVSLLDHDDTLAPFALYEIVKVINETNADFIYSDEDKIDEFGKRRFEPHFKPDWSPDTLRSYNYITHLVTVKLDLLKDVGGFRDGFEGAQDHDLILRSTNNAKHIYHIPMILYHWRAHSLSVAGNGESKLYAFESGERAVYQQFKDSNIKGIVEDGLFLGSYRARYHIKGSPKVTIIIPNKDKRELLEALIDSIIEKTTYSNYEIYVIENGSKEEETFNYYKQIENKDGIYVHTFEGKFNYSAVNNFAARLTDAPFLIFLNNDMKVISPDWIEAMLEHAQRPEIGIVGAKLLYENNSIQHAGVVIGMGGWADHVCAKLNVNEYKNGFYCKYLIDCIRNTSAVTGACMMVEKRKFDEIGGFDEEFILCGSDVEICIKMMDRGYLNIYTPFSKLYHYESVTRKNIEIPAQDFKYSYKAYKKYLQSYDPYYSPNLDYRKNIPAILNEKICIMDLNSYGKEEKNEKVH